MFWLQGKKAQAPVKTVVQTQSQQADAQASVSQKQASQSTAAANKDVVDSMRYLVDDFLKQYSSLSKENADFVKKITDYANSPVDSSPGPDKGKKVAYITAIADGLNPGIVYFVDESRTGISSDTNNVSADVYSLNTKTNELKAIHKQDPVAYHFYLVGRQGGELLFAKIDTMDSPGPCYNDWIYAYENPLPRPKSQYPNQRDSRTIKSLDINNPSTGFQDYAVSKEKYDSELTIQKACQDDMDAAIRSEQQTSDILNASNK
ncbi:MAG TPA: hypothetical protein VF817_03030 [Patescibacteria group bacterium]